MLKLKYLLCIVTLVMSLVGTTGCLRIPVSEPTVTPQTGNYQPSDELDGSQWKVISINGTRLAMGSYLSIYFRKGTIWGSDGLNIYGAKYSVQAPDSLNIFDGMLTALGGPENLMRQEEAYFKYLYGLTTYRINGNHLEITRSTDTKPLLFERLPEYPANPSDLVGTKWQLVSLNGDPVTLGAVTLRFDSDTKASGTAGNLAYELSLTTSLYESTGDDIRWGITDHRIGDPRQKVDHLAGRYTTSITWAANYHLTADRLEIFTTRGETLVYKPSPPPATDYQSFVDALLRQGAPVKPKGDTAFPGNDHPQVLSGAGKRLEWNNENISVLEYADDATAEAETKLVSADGYQYSSKDRRMIVDIEWVAPPHFYRAGRIIVLYNGEKQETISLLTTLLGAPFAGTK